MDPFIDPSLGSYYRQFPLVLADVGASKGLPKLWKPLEGRIQILGFEPNEQSYARLLQTATSGSTRYMNIALYEEKTLLNLYVTREGTDSSIFEPNLSLLKRFPNPERFEVVGAEKMNADTLDNQLQEHEIKDVDFIKLDTQGSELSILKGSQQALKRSVFGLQIEVEFVPLYQDQPLFQNVNEFVRRSGFQLFDLSPVYWKRAVGKNCGGPKGQMIFADVLYLRDLESFMAMLEPIENGTERKAKVLKALSVCIIYGYYDYAMEICREARHLLEASEANLIEEKIAGATVASTRLPNFPGRRKLSSLFYHLSQILRPAHAKGKLSRKTIGNVE